VNPWSTYCQIVADELNMSFEDINIKTQDLDAGFAFMSPDGSCCLCSNGNVLRKAARKAKKMLLELAAQKFEDVEPADLEIQGREVYVKGNPTNRKTIKEIVKMAMPMFDSCVFWTEAPIIAWAWHTQGIWGNAITTGRPRLCRQAHFLEIEVDTETGKIEVKKLVNVNDVGKAVSPETVEGQMYGGSYMGVGRALTEEMIWDGKTGVLLNRNLLDYKYAAMNDSGPIEAIYLETGLGHGPYGACGIGESTPTIVPAMFGPAVYNAIGKWIDDFPITPDKVLKALGKA
jgi:xanthine dehydrogenase molybdenum-binding subunit